MGKFSMSRSFTHVRLSKALELIGQYCYVPSVGEPLIAPAIQPTTPSAV